MKAIEQSVLSCGAVYYTVQGGSNFEVRDSQCVTIQGKLPSHVHFCIVHTCNTAVKYYFIEN